MFATDRHHIAPTPNRSICKTVAQRSLQGRPQGPFARCFTLHDEVGHPENVTTTNGTMLRHLMPTHVAKSSALAALLDTNVLDAIQSSGKVAPYLLHVLRLLRRDATAEELLCRLNHSGFLTREAPKRDQFLQLQTKAIFPIETNRTHNILFGSCTRLPG